MIFLQKKKKKLKNKKKSDFLAKEPLKSFWAFLVKTLTI